MWCCSRILPRALLHSYALHLSPAFRDPPQPYHVQRAVDVLGCALQPACELPLETCCKGRVTKGVFGGESDASAWMIQARFEGDSEAICGRFKGDSGTFRAIRVLGHVSRAGPSSGGGLSLIHI